MATGTVKWFNESKGYGFIESDEGEDVFVHYSAIEGEGFRNLQEGQRVEFERTSSPKGPRAERVTIVSDYAPVSVVEEPVEESVEAPEPVEAVEEEAPEPESDEEETSATQL
jgi:CspA family cold shock protein